jgi:hypothetical protein
MTDASSKQQAAATVHSGMASGDDLKRILGDIEDSKVIEILALKPTLAEVEEAAAWASGDGDILGKSGHPLTSVVAQIVEIVTADEEEPEPRQ